MVSFVEKKEKGENFLLHIKCGESVYYDNRCSRLIATRIYEYTSFAVILKNIFFL